MQLLKIHILGPLTDIINDVYIVFFVPNEGLRIYQNLANSYEPFNIYFKITITRPYSALTRKICLKIILLKFGLGNMW